jgi:spermidine synthase
MNNYKYLKYLLKSNTITHLLTQKGGAIFRIKSALDESNYISSERPPNKLEPGGMWFNDAKNIYQSMYNIYDIQKFYLNYMYILYTCINYITKIDKVLIIGLGGGQLPMLLKYHFPYIQVKIIELDASVIKAANYMGFSESDKIKVIVGDGIDYCNNSTETDYDVCIIDLDAGSTVEKFNYEKVSKVINKNGVIGINYFNRSKQPESLSKKLIPYFKTIKIYPSNVNYVYICKLDNDPILNLPLTYQTVNDLLKQHKYIHQIIEKTNVSKSTVINSSI